MKKKLYLGNGVYITIQYSKKINRYKIVLEFYDERGIIARRLIDYCDTYIDAYYHYNELKKQYFTIF